ncbi:MAG: hypothetical protein RJB31_1769 [Bacteroidota bacterium]
MKLLKSHKSLFIAVLLIIFAQWFMISDQRVEQWYAQGVYPYVSGLLQFSLGWIPFSVGDLLYCVVIVWAAYRIWRFASIVRAQGFKNWWKGYGQLLGHFLKFLTVFAWVWILFHMLWGFNYYRKSIPDQFGFVDERPSPQELHQFTQYLLNETNRYAIELKASPLDISAHGNCSTVINQHPKASLFGVIGNYMGYGGYYNPFTGEAQINAHMPAFMLPFIAVHEKAHQLGYAKESEANFMGYLAAMQSADSCLIYSANLEMFIYANNALSRSDSVAARNNFKALSPIAIKDLKNYRAFVKKYQGPIDEFTTWFYTKFLRLNNQPEGMYSYNRGMVYVMRYLNKKPA